MRTVFICLCLLLLLSNVNSSLYVNEISFNGDEFIEIYSNESLYLNGSQIFDENTQNISNTLTLYSQKNSSFYLIIGSNFKNNNDLENLDCTIYLTDRSQVSYGGLNNAGENFLIKINQTDNISWTKNQMWDFDTNETLNYNLSQNVYYKSFKSPCSQNLIQKISINQSKDNLSNYTNQTNQSNHSLQTDSCNYFFQINPKQEIFTSKLEYDFETNASNYTINYWIEDYLKNVVKNPVNTTNTNKKVYTPKDFTNIYNIKAILYINNCSINDSKQVIFFSPNTKEQPKETTKATSSSSSKTTTSESKSSKSYIKIINKDDIKILKTNILQYEVYRGNTQKRTVYIYLNKHKITSFDVEKYATIKGKIELDIENRNNEILIEGLDKFDNLTIYKNSTTTTNTQAQSKSSTKFQTNNLNISNSKLTFNIQNLPQNTTTLCYINFVRTTVSDTLNLSQNETNINHLTLNIDNDKLQKKEKLENYPLKLHCKYQKPQSEYFTYETKEFNYTIQSSNMENIISKNILSVFNLTKYSKTEDKNISINSTYTSNTLQNDIPVNLNNNKISEQKEEQNTNYISKTSKIKNKSIFLIFLGTSTLLSMFILRW